jgi:hypothetical protein
MNMTVDAAIADFVAQVAQMEAEAWLAAPDDSGELMEAEAANAAIDDFVEQMEARAWFAAPDDFGELMEAEAANAATDDFVEQRGTQEMWPQEMGARQVSPPAAGQPQSQSSGAGAGAAFPVFWPAGQPATPGAFSTAAHTHPLPDHAPSSSLRRRGPADPAAAPQGWTQPPAPGGGAHGR